MTSMASVCFPIARIQPVARLRLTVCFWAHPVWCAFLTNHRPGYRMGRSYWFECPRCGYRARVSGREDGGLAFCVQTVLCQDCKELYDAVTRLSVPDEPLKLGILAGWRWGRLVPARDSSSPPSFQAVLNRLPLPGVTRFKWLRFKPQCPVSEIHRVRSWKDPDKCPKCGVFLEKSALPYRFWD
jgi:hypothetical protein